MRQHSQALQPALETFPFSQARLGLESATLVQQLVPGSTAVAPPLATGTGASRLGPLGVPRPLYSSTPVAAAAEAAAFSAQAVSRQGVGRRLTCCMPTGTKHRRHSSIVSTLISPVVCALSSIEYLSSHAHSTVFFFSHELNVSPCCAQNSSAVILEGIDLRGAHARATRAVRIHIRAH